MAALQKTFLWNKRVKQQKQKEKKQGKKGDKEITVTLKPSNYKTRIKIRFDTPWR